MSSLVAGSAFAAGRYRLEEVIGRGGMAMVWRARDLQLERDVALKVISDVLASDPQFVERFEREARTAARLNHPNLVKIFDFSVEAERPFLVMELVSGGTLADARGRPLDAESLARELLDAVAHIHAAGILHRDIKPANVLLGADLSPRLTDFGIARGDETTGLTQTGQVMGTLRYIAPEVAAGEPATPRSDLYSLGVLLSEISGPGSEALTRLVARMTASDPSVRPATAVEALADLDPTQLLPRSKSLTDRGQSPTIPLEQWPPAPESPKSKSLTSRGLSPLQAVGGAALLLAVLVLVVLAASGGGGDSAQHSTTPTIAPSSAPASQQIDSLERAVRALPSR